MLARMGGLPAHTSVDGGPWLGLKEMLIHVYGDVDQITPIQIAGEVRDLCAVLCTRQHTVTSALFFQMTAVRIFNKTSSKRQTPVERQWRELNRTMEKWKAEFKLLESAGYFHPENPAQIFSLVQVYGSVITRDLDTHYNGMRFWVKRKSTTSPRVPKKRRTRIQLFKETPSRITPLTMQEIAELQEVAERFCGDETPTLSQTDSLRHWPHAIAARDALIRMYRRDAAITLPEEYALHSAFSESFLEKNDTVSACDDAIDKMTALVSELF